ncbi:pyridoxamine 5'-phosphate oxidase family protein [Brevibacterium daeguense]|uniref:Pyridoxamine 5'-phosphate oxidase family protein n=1 Tax=Brevibacterium daeguense TaxID=909936 RepID=A0ABP8ENR1_9MICO|nr:pyridoxamine 5'-phosphate oxidase family protein [Brevibacterium daeguense]
MSTQNPMQEIPEQESLQLLTQKDVGRLVFRVGDDIEIFPINYHADGRELTFRSAPGTKLAGSIIAGRAIFEVDDIGEDEVWSVIVRGSVRLLDTAAEISAAEELELQPLVPTVKRFFVRLDVDEVSGRRFHRGPEPEPDVEPTD